MTNGQDWASSVHCSYWRMKRERGRARERETISETPRFSGVVSIGQ
jgi:hypothetical protein